MAGVPGRGPRAGQPLPLPGVRADRRPAPAPGPGRRHRRRLGHLGFFPYERHPLGIGRPVAAGLTDLQGMVYARGLELDAAGLLRATGLAAMGVRPPPPGAAHVRPASLEPPPVADHRARAAARRVPRHAPPPSRRPPSDDPVQAQPARPGGRRGPPRGRVHGHRRRSARLMHWKSAAVPPAPAAWTGSRTRGSSSWWSGCTPSAPTGSPAASPCSTRATAGRRPLRAPHRQPALHLVPRLRHPVRQVLPRPAPASRDGPGLRRGRPAPHRHGPGRRTTRSSSRPGP